MRNRPLLSFVLTVLVASACALGSGAATLEVPAQHPTINAAIAAAVTGDTVRVAPGTYVENVDFLGKEILLTSHYVPGGDWGVVERTVIDGSSPDDPNVASTVVFQYGEGRDAVLQGFTITGGQGTVWVDPQYPTYTWRGGGGIFSFQSSPAVRFNLVTGNLVENLGDVDGAQAGGMLFYDGDPLVQSNVIASNQADYGGGLVVDYSGATVQNNLIVANTGGVVYGGGGVWTIGNGSTPILFENNALLDNVSDTAGGAIYSWGSAITVRNSIIWGNQQTQGDPIYVRSGGFVDASYCDIEGGYSGLDIIDVDPLFADATCVLDPASPCVDQGDPATADQDPEDPADPGSARWPSRGGLRNDMGAFGGPGAVFIGFDPALVFADGFESGELSAWSSAVP